jgi:hypothetical protein
MMETRPIAVETRVSGRRRMIALPESQREPADWDRRIHGDPRRAYAGEVVHAISNRQMRQQIVSLVEELEAVKP